MKNNKKKYCIWIFLSVTVIMLAIIAIPRWKSIYEIEYCTNLQNETITEITMRATSDSVEEVVFSDKDLIDAWTSFFDGVLLKFNWKHTYFPNRIAGGHPKLIVQTEKGKYNLTFHPTKDGYLLIIDKKRYLIKDPETVPFSQIYEAAVERHGTVSIFGN